MNEEQAKQYVNEKCKGLPVTSEEDARKVLDIIWQAACEWRDSQVLRTTEEDPCPACRPNTVCRTPLCGRLKGKRQEPITPPAAQINQPVIAKIADDLALTLHKLLQKNYKFRPFSSDHPDIEAAEKALLEYQKEMSRQFSEQFGGQD